MATLIKRATDEQRRIYRIVRGAVLNAADAHPGMDARDMAESIAKRATGTLTAQIWPEVLAGTDRPSDEADAIGEKSPGTAGRGLTRGAASRSSSVEG